MLLFVGYYRGNLLDTFLEHDAKKHNKPSTLETMVMEIFAKRGWSSFKRMGTFRSLRISV
jgi:hypothetical protein